MADNGAEPRKPASEIGGDGRLVLPQGTILTALTNFCRAGPRLNFRFFRRGLARALTPCYFATLAAASTSETPRMTTAAPAPFRMLP